MPVQTGRRHAPRTCLPLIAVACTPHHLTPPHTRTHENTPHLTTQHHTAQDHRQHDEATLAACCNTQLWRPPSEQPSHKSTWPSPGQARPCQSCAAGLPGDCPPVLTGLHASLHHYTIQSTEYRDRACCCRATLAVTPPLIYSASRSSSTASPAIGDFGSRCPAA